MANIERFLLDDQPAPVSHYCHAVKADNRLWLYRSKINPLRQEYFGEHRPASTLVEVSALVIPALKVEIEAEAVLDS